MEDSVRDRTGRWERRAKFFRTPLGDGLGGILVLVSLVILPQAILRG